MGDPNLIVTLVPRNKLAAEVCRLPHNSRLQLAPPRIAQTSTTPSRKQEVLPLQLTFREEPRIPEKGYSFGTNLKGDVLLGESGIGLIGSQNFCLSFNRARNLVLIDTSQAGTTVSYNGKKQKR